MKCPNCGGPADQGHDRCFPPNPYYCTKCEALEMTDEKDKGAMRDAFEAFLKDKSLSNEKSFDVFDSEIYKHSKIEAMWYAWKECWNQRATPSPQKPGEVDAIGVGLCIREALHDMGRVDEYLEMPNGEKRLMSSVIEEKLAATGRLNAVPGGCYIPYEVEEHGIKWRLLGGHYGTTEHIGMTLNTYTSPKEPAGADKGVK